MEDTTLADLLTRCRRSHYYEVADVLEHYGEHDTDQFGPVYKPFDAPTDDTELAKRLLWAFRAGRAYEYEQHPPLPVE